MPNIYISKETRILLDKAAKAERRTLDGQIAHLCEARLREMESDSGMTSVKGHNSTPNDGKSQENNAA